MRHFPNPLTAATGFLFGAALGTIHALRADSWETVFGMSGVYVACYWLGVFKARGLL